MFVQKTIWLMLFFVSFCILPGAALNTNNLRGRVRQLEEDATDDELGALQQKQLFDEDLNDLRQEIPISAAVPFLGSAASSQTSVILPEFVSQSPQFLLLGPLLLPFALITLLISTAGF